jgi:hypothetical protein
MQQFYTYSVIHQYQRHTFISINVRYIAKMTSQSPDMLSHLDSELFEIPDSPALNRTQSSPSMSSSTTTTTKSRRYSKVWLHTPVSRNEVILNKEGKSIWRCKYCITEYRESGGTTIIASHLKEQHNINVSSAQEARTTLMQANIADAFNNAQQTPDYKRRCLSSVATRDLDPAIIEQLYVRWITTCGVSFRMATLPEFRVT